jgi:hypothetical protein
MSTTELLRKQVSTCLINGEREGRAIRKILGGCNIIEYGILEIQDEAKAELKMRASNTVKWAISTMEWLIGHPNATPQHKEKFKEEYHNNDRNAMLAELFDTVIDLNADDLALITESIKAHIDTKKSNPHSHDPIYQASTGANL